jgi:hypothetical protein
MAIQTQITLSDDLVRNVQQGSVKTSGDLIRFNEVMASNLAPFHYASHNNFKRCLVTTIATKEELSAVRIPLNEQSARAYTVDKYSSLLDVLKDTTGSN